MVTVAGEKKLWDGGLIGASVWLALHGEVAATSANEFSTSDSAAYPADSYARVEMETDDWSVSDLTGAASNAAAVAFAEPGADADDWPPALAVSIWTAETGGDMLDATAVRGAALVGANGDAVEFAAGQLIIDV